MTHSLSGTSNATLLNWPFDTSSQSGQERSLHSWDTDTVSIVEQLRAGLQGIDAGSRVSCLRHTQSTNLIRGIPLSRISGTRTNANLLS
jgi:hypothetical protein